ncbi:UNVERIFIED_CONTAM: hypothetical protein Scaly_2979200 [Sesamum calycinum]|uniref:DUF4218 domain-containing protein n=1 Tax=Sesamum calycinum TaxID=2727403 RepID=A0AAW2KL64_9LAMI
MLDWICPQMGLHSTGSMVAHTLIGLLYLHMSSEYIFLTIVIPDPSNPKRLIDVYLEPFIVELQNLWHVGVKTHDSAKDETFTMHAALMWTVNDLPAYGMASRWSIAVLWGAKFVWKTHVHCIYRTGEEFIVVVEVSFSLPDVYMISFLEMFPKSVWSALIEVSLLFQILCSTTLDVNKVQELKASVAIIFCNLEKIFSLSFFDSMEHLIVHLPYEVRVGGLVQYRWMYLFERLFSTTLDDLVVPQRRYGLVDENATSSTSIDMSVNKSFPNELDGKYHPKDPIIEELVATQFKVWFKYCVKSDLNYIDNDLLKLHYWGPTFPCYLMNDTDSDFYGMLGEIIQLDYPLIPNMQIVLFKYCWVDPLRGMKVHPCYHLIDVNFKKVYQKNEPFILAQQAVQVYYTEYPSMKRDKVDWMVVYKTKARRVINGPKWHFKTMRQYRLHKL